MSSSSLNPQNAVSPERRSARGGWCAAANLGSGARVRGVDSVAFSVCYTSGCDPVMGRKPRGRRAMRRTRKPRVRSES